MRIAIHQPNLIPYFSFFYKMALADRFIILSHVQFEKNNYQNRYYLNTKEKWVTKSINSGTSLIKDKRYFDGKNLLNTNMQWIFAIRETLNITTTINYDFPTDKIKTDRLIEIIKYYGGDTYITCPEAKEKYLDEDLMRSAGITIEYYVVPKEDRVHIFEMFERYGIDGTINRLPIKIDGMAKEQLSCMVKESMLCPTQYVAIL